MRMAAEDSYAAGGPGGASGAAAPSATGAESYAGMEEQAERRQDDVDVAQRYLDAGDATSAESVLEETLRTRPSPGATFLLAEAYARQGRWSEAARMYDLFLARYLDDPRADEARWRAAAAYRRSGALARAEALLEQLVGVPGYDSRARTAIDEMTATEAAPSDVPAAAAPAEQQP
jgi:tetratricopeptide (TPR) repeat protein